MSRRYEKTLSENFPHCPTKIVLFAIIASSLFQRFAFGQEVFLSPQVGHSESISALALSPDEQHAVSGAADGKLVIWSLRTMKALYVWSGHESDQFLGKYPAVNSVAWSPNGKYIASVGGDCNLIVWEASSGKIVFKEYQGSDEIESVEFSEDSKSVFIGLKRGEIKIYVAEFDEVVIPFGDAKKPSRYAGSLVGHQEPVRIIKRIGAKKLLSASADAFDKKGSIRVWDLENKKEIFSVKLQEYVYGVALSPDEKQMAMVGSSETIKIWELNGGKTLRSVKFSAKDYARYSISYGADEKTIAICGDDMRFFDATTGKLKRVAKISGLNLTRLKRESAFLSTFANQIRLLDAEKATILRESFAFASATERIAVHPDEKWFLTAGNDGKLRIWDMKTASLKQTIERSSTKLKSVKFFPDGKKVAVINDADIEIIEIETGELKRTIKKGHEDIINEIAISPDGKEIASASDDRSVRIWSAESGAQAERIPVEGRVLSVEFGESGKTLFCGTALSELLKIDREKKKIQSFSGRHSGQAGKIPMIAARKDGKRIVTADWATSDPKEWNVESLNLARILGEKVDEEKSQNRKSPKIPSSSNLLRERLNEAHSGRILSVAYSPDGREIATGSEDRTIKIWDAESGKCIKTLKGHKGSVTSMAFTPDGKYLVSGSADGTAKAWNRQNGECFTFSANGNQWIVYANDGYWDGSENCENLVAIVKGMESWNIDQFAAKNNRPDKILEKIEYADREEIAYYKKQHEKRLRRLGLKEERLSSEENLPAAKILETALKGKFLELKIEFSDDGNELKSYNVYVNNVPAFSGLGKRLEGGKKEIKETIELGFGLNKVEVSCVNENGKESFRALTYALYEKPEKRSLYYLGFGVSKHKNSALDLDYAEKDARDLEATLKGLKGKQFDAIHSKIYSNESVTREAIREAKEFLKQAKVDDVIVLFVAGHGMHSKDLEANYYFLASESDVEDLENTAIRFELIEELLQGVAPRSKLFLIDACESGEIDELDESAVTLLAAKSGIKSRGIRREGKKESKGAPRKYLYDRARYIYNDLSRRSGAVVFSSSKGSELSYESKEMENGLFTECIMRALSSGVADENQDNLVSVEELRRYVTESVSRASNGLQNPTVDRDNIFQKFGFKIK